MVPRGASVLTVPHFAGPRTTNPLVRALDSRCRRDSELSEGLEICVGRHPFAAGCCLPYSAHHT